MRAFKFILFVAIFALGLNGAEVSLRAKVSQMIMVGFNGASTKDAAFRAMLSDAGYERFGGVMLLGKNITNKAQLKSSIKAIKEKSPKIFIAIDEEGGNVSRMKDKSFDGPYLSAYDLYSKMAINLKECGINLNFAPVVDLYDENSPIIAAKQRAFSEYASKVVIYADAFMDAFKEQDILTTLKHFPGHGSSKEDSHKNKSEVTLSKDALLPYKDAISTGRAQIIMVGHLFVKGIDEDNPATLSKKIITDLLRNELKFNGVVISDDMLMKGVGDEALAQKVLKFINAGGDILLFSEFKINNQRTADLVAQIIIDAVNEKKISKERIDASYKRIMALKAKL